MPILKIDTFLEKQNVGLPIRFIKVDVQGYEFPVCKGMERTLRDNPSAILALEYMPEAMRELGFQGKELLSWLGDRGYRAYSIEKDGSLKLYFDDLSREHGYVDLLFSNEQLRT